MTAPLSQDLRRRIVRAVEAGRSARQAAERFEVSASAAIKLMRRVRESGSPAPGQIGGHRRPMLESHADLIRALVAGRPRITLAELQVALRERGIQVKALSTIALMLRRLGLSHKKHAESRRAGQARCRPASTPLAGVAALHGCRPFGVPGRDRRKHEHGSALRLGTEGLALACDSSAWTLAHHDLCSGATSKRGDRALCAGWAKDGRGVPRLRQTGARA